MKTNKYLTLTISRQYHTGYRNDKDWEASRSLYLVLVYWTVTNTLVKIACLKSLSGKFTTVMFTDSLRRASDSLGFTSRYIYETGASPEKAE